MKFEEYLEVALYVLSCSFDLIVTFSPWYRVERFKSVPNVLRFPRFQVLIYHKSAVKAENPWERQALRFRTLTD